MDRANWLTWIALCASSVGGGLMGFFPVGAAKPAPGAPNGWRVLDAVTYENLSVFPIVSAKAGETSGFVTLDEALASGDALVTEQGGDILRRTRDARPIPAPQASGPSVNQLVLINRGSKPLVLLAGELVSGGKQDRIIAKDRIVPPGAPPLPLDVFCVEHGRWSSGAQFAAAKIIVHPSVREKAAVDRRQDEVWAAVRNGTTAAAAPNAPPPAFSAGAIAQTIQTEARSESYKRIYESSRVGASVDTFAEEVRKRFARATHDLKGEHVVGVVIAYGGEVAWSDVFASPALFDRYWPKLLRSYVVEALARPQTHEHASPDDAREFLQPLEGRENVESEPNVYRWRQVTQGHYAEIQLQALRPVDITLHRLKIHRTS